MHQYVLGYQHNDSFPGSHPLAAGPLGYNGSKAGMELIQKADVVLALGTRLNPFSTLPGYGMDYWPKDASIIQVDMNSDRIGLTKKVSVGICGDAKLVSQQILLNFHQQLVILIDKKEKILFIKLNQLGYKNYQVLIMKMMMKEQFGTKKPEKEILTECLLDMAWRAIQAGMPDDVIISSDIGNNCAIGNAYPTLKREENI